MYTKRINKFVDEILNEDIDDLGYFYVNIKPEFSINTILFPYSQIFDATHLLVLFNEERIIISTMNNMGDIADEYFDIYLDDVKDIYVNRSFMRTKIKIEFYDEEDNVNSISLKPLNICIGMAKHKSSLIELNNMYN